MNPLNVIESELAGLGYQQAAIIRDYSFADVIAPLALSRRIPLAAFTQTPPSYRSAAFGVLLESHGHTSNVIANFRALGAPIIFSISDNLVVVWQVHSSAPARRITEKPANELPALFSEYRDRWTPLAVQRAKSLGLINPTYQLDFIDIGLLPAIEKEIHVKLDRLIQEVMTDLTRGFGLSRATPTELKEIFQTTFRLLAMKILKDRNHPTASNWGELDGGKILLGIRNYYKLDDLPLTNRISPGAIENAWRRLQDALSLQNISADDLAFAYEDTLVTRQTRKIFGTHSTPRQVAEYIVANLQFERFPRDTLRIYEPFTGAGTFLVSAARRIRELLPADWNDEKRHAFLTLRISGSELDAFAKEVANLSLILADYPNANGWRLWNEDLFDGSILFQRVHPCNIVLCNPPFEDFTVEERSRYPVMAGLSLHKPIAVLQTVLSTAPEAIGFVLPRDFILEKRYALIRQHLEELYSSFDIVSLPDGIFRVSQMESALLIAQDRRTRAGSGATRLRSITVKDSDRHTFLQAGQVSSIRKEVRSMNGRPRGDLWVKELSQIWEYLVGMPELGDLANIHRGLEWNYPQQDAVSDRPLPGFYRGLLNADSLRQFVSLSSVYLDCRGDSMRGGAFHFPWNEEKIVANAVRLSRGAWRIAAATDRTGLICSQQFFGIWPKEEAAYGCDAISAILNNPMANAFLAVNSLANRFRIKTLKSLPVPIKIEERAISSLIELYHDHLSLNEPSVGQDNLTQSEILVAIDSIVLKAYDLPPKLERSLLTFFQGQDRPTVDSFRGWFPDDFSPFIPLHEYISAEYRKITGDWIVEVFKKIPQEEAKLLNRYLNG